MQVITYRTADSLLARVQAILERQEAVNNVILATLAALARAPQRYKEYHLITVEDAFENNSEVVVIAVWIPPSNVSIYAERNDPAAMLLLANYLHDQGLALPGVTGQVDTVSTFADSWNVATGSSWHVHLQMRLYELRQVNFPTNGQGKMVQATMEHQALLSAWGNAFGQEALGNPPNPDEAARLVNLHLEQGTMFLWCVDSKPVSMAVKNRQTQHGAVIAFVYTPPDQRGHGYASALVAALSQMILDSGKEFCALFTDLENPTSNSIYQKIGYVPLTDFDEVKF